MTTEATDTLYLKDLERILSETEDRTALRDRFKNLNREYADSHMGRFGGYREAKQHFIQLGGNHIRKQTGTSVSHALGI